MDVGITRAAEKSSRQKRTAEDNLVAMNSIPFYNLDEPYGSFSNFSRHAIYLKDKIWPTSEHYFQAQKFAGTPFEEQVRQASSPRQAAEMGRDRAKPLRSDWETVKEDVMRAAVRAKFTQHPDLGKMLLSTGDALLVEHTAHDRYWADGGDGSGQNRLGHILMEIRQELLQATVDAKATTAEYPEYQRDQFTVSADQAKLDIGVIHRYLAQESYWGQGRPLEVIQRSIAHSLCFGVYAGDQQVGFARVVTDYATFAWLCDVFVLESHRGLGLGKWLVECIVNYPSLQGLRRMMLATRDAHGLYHDYGGFEQLSAPERWMERFNPMPYR